MRYGRHMPYADTVGVQTIGYGRAIGRIGISEDEASLLLEHDVDRSISDLDFACSWWRNLDEARQGALAELCFQLGLNGLLGFRRTLDALRSGRYAEAAADLLESKYATQVPSRAQRIAAVIAGDAA
jgi:lysozyme